MNEPDTAHAAALRDLRAAEAARVLGLLDTTTLPDRARFWVRQGLATPAARALAGHSGRPEPGRELVLLATLAAECGVSIHDVGTARAVQARAIIDTVGRGGDAGQSLFDLSNSVTDSATDRLRRWWRGRRS